MRFNSSDEIGQTFVEIIRTIVVVSVTILILVIVGRLFFRVMFEDSVVDATLKEVSSRAITASSRMMQGNEELVGSEFKERSEKGYPVLTYKINDNFFEITLIGVPKAVCRRIVERKWTLPTSLYVNGNLANSLNHFCSDFNLVSFEFSRDLNSNVPDSEKPVKKHCRTDADCSACEACRNNLCKTSCNAGESCSLSLKGYEHCCPVTQEADSLCCAYVENGNCCWGRNKCCPMDRPILLEDGTCTNCFDSKPFLIGGEDSLETCQKLCPNRVPFGADDLCMLPICEKEQFLSRDGDCLNCQAEGAFKTSAQECAKCPQRTYHNGWCSFPCPESTIQDEQGRCMSCNTLETIFIQDQDVCIKKCPNRQKKQQGCALKTCPEGMIFDKEGNCISCDLTNAILSADSEECAACPNREIVNGVCVPICSEGYFRALSGECISCSDKEAFPVVPASGECLKCPDRLSLENYCFASCKQGEFRDANGACRSCLGLESYPVVQTAACSVCPYRSILLKHDKNEDMAYCKLQQCPMDYFSDRNGSCYDCFQKESIVNTSKEECEKCPNRVWSPENSSCLIHTSCPSNTFMDTYGQCHSCDENNALISVAGHLTECDKCFDRYVYGHWCRKCPEQIDVLTTKESCQKCGGKWDNRIQGCS